MKKLILLASAFFVFVSAVTAQNFTQTIRGRVTDHQSGAPLPGVNIIVIDIQPMIGATSDDDGYYVIENVPIGRVTLQATYVGYDPITLSNMELTSGKELVQNIEMDEQVIMIEEVVIRASEEKIETNNEMATVSARQFTIEESMRYAGARNDVSRMAQNFAGVRGANDAVNDIIIRGNSPVGLLWRLEGVDIPNPNHFGDFGSTGGPVSMLNNNVLSNSDFMTSAFPAEYGNAISGVFDLKMRNGNIDNHEFLGQIGLNGIEVGAEGPINRESRSSYLLNYRYSTLSIMSALGINFGTGTAIPYYQDATFKLNFPTKKFGNVSIFGLGGLSQIDLISSDAEDTVDNLYNNDLDIYDRTKIGVAGITHTYFFDNTSYTKLTLAVSSIINNDIVDSISSETFEPVDFYEQHFTLTKFTGSFYYKKKIDAKNNLQAGIRFEEFVADMTDSMYNKNLDRYQTLTHFEGSTWLIQPYVQYQHKFNEKLTFNGGLHFQYLGLNGSNSIEPRAGFKYAVTETDLISVGYGLHSIMAPIATFFKTVEIAPGEYIAPNDSIGFVKAHHIVIGYDKMITPTFRVKAEAYYQYLYDVIVDKDSSSFSVLNIGSFTFGSPDYLMNSGTGENYGVELTVEKFLDKGFYFLVTGSFYDSRYIASDGLQRQTAFAGNYVTNFLGGKEFNLNANKENIKSKKMLVLDVKLTAAGGQRYTPIDLEESIEVGETQYDWDRAFSLQYKDYFRLDGRLGFKMNGKHLTQEWAVDIQNITNRQNPLYERYNPVDQEINTVYQLGIFPVGQYRITF